MAMFLMPAAGMFPEALVEVDPKRDEVALAEEFPGTIYFYA